MHRKLHPMEAVILRAIRERYPESPRDQLTFVHIPVPAMIAVNSNAVLTVWGDGKGPSFDLTNLAGFVQAGGMSLEDVMKEFVDATGK
jgi:hypothetical protein